MHFGPIVEVAGLASNQAGRYPAEDIVTGTFRFASGVQGIGTWCFTAFDKFDRCGDCRRCRKNLFLSFDATPVQASTLEGINEYVVEYPQHIEQPLIQTVVDELNGVGHCPSTGKTAAQTSYGSWMRCSRRCAAPQLLAEIRYLPRTIVKTIHEIARTFTRKTRAAWL